MKKRILSSLLMGALFVASMSTFTSCKDYDDDINNLQAQIDKAALASDVTALQTTVNTATTNAATALKTAQDAATAASTNALAITAVKATADQAAKDVATAITNAATAQTTAEAAAKAAATAQDSANAAIKAAAKAQAAATNAASDATKALEQIGNIEKNYVTSTTLADKLASLKAEILADTTSNATLVKLSGQVKSFKGSINYLYSAVTSVELFGTYSGDGYTWDSSLRYGAAVDLTMFHGSISKSSLFGNNETYSKAPKIVSFVKGDEIANDAGVILRVNPTDVDLSTANIKLINSKGEELTQVVLGKREKFTDLITTRSTINSGLWKVGFKVAPGVTEKEFKKAVMSGDNQILFAVAVNNTAAADTSTAAKDRYVASTWDVAPAYETYAPANYLEYKVNNTPVTKIHNRWNGSKTAFEDGTAQIDSVELTWKKTIDDKITPDTAYTATDNNTVKDDDDARYDQPPLTVQVGTAFTVAIANVNYRNAKYIKSYYVVFDKYRALESAPSEWNAWSKYDIDGLNKMVDAEDKLDMTINSQAAQGDIIGFRVFAVNYDGTLVDPDGRAFYVQVGDKAINTESVAASVTATSTNNGLNAVTANLKGNANTAIVALSKSKVFVDCGTPIYGMITFAKADNPSILDDNINVFWSLQADNNGTPASSWSEAKYIAVSIDKPGLMKDGATLTATINGQKTTKGYAETVNTINLAVTKVMPTAAPKEISWKTSYFVNGTYTCYLAPGSGNWNNLSTYGTTELDKIANNIGTGYSWAIGNAKADNNGNYTEELPVALAATAKIPNKLINNTEAHSLAVKYTYEKISCTADKYGVLTSNKNYTIDAKTGNIIFACALNPSIQSYAWNSVHGETGETDTKGHKIYADYTNYYITFGCGTLTLQTDGKGGIETNLNLINCIKGTNSVFSDFTNSTFVNNYVGTAIADYTATLTSDENGKSDYYT